jgi:hypothetical protein
MKVAVLDDSGALTWSRGPGPQGISMRQAAVLLRVVAALRAALAEAEGQLSGLQVSDAVADVRRPAAEIDCGVPVTSAGHAFPNREMGIVTAEMGKAPARPIGAENSHRP